MSTKEKWKWSVDGYDDWWISYGHVSCAVESEADAEFLCRLLNAGERAKAEVKRLRAAIAAKPEWPPCGNADCRRCR